MDKLIERLEAGEFEAGQSVRGTVWFAVERAFGHFFRQFPPMPAPPFLLNLGCGPHIFEGWVNADIYGMARGLRDRRFRPNWRLDFGRTWECRDEYWHAIFTEHALDALPYSRAVFCLRECLRTLKPGGWIRVSLADLDKHLEEMDFPHRAVAAAWIGQMHGHRSVWTADLLIDVMRSVGFTDVQERAFRDSSMAELAMDDPGKQHESFYVEARKP